MRLSEPPWWYAEQPHPYASLLQPLSKAYAWAACRRIAQRAGYRSELPVICIGNFTAGGSGKTPLALAIAKSLLGASERPAFLTRGYGGRLGGPKLVDPAGDDARDVGDEPLLLAKLAPTMVARDRGVGARALEALEPRPSVIVMDDGLHNPGLAKDLVIVAVDGGRGLGNGEVIPAGPLRAPLELQLGMTDAIVINEPPIVAESGEAWRQWLRQRFTGPVLTARARPSGDTQWAEGAEVVAFAGIVNPQRFFDMIEGLGAKIVAAIPFPDHHAFRAEEASRLMERASRNGAALVTTEKDWVRLPASGGLTAELRARTRPVPMDLVFDDREFERLELLVLPVRKKPSA